MGSEQIEGRRAATPSGSRVFALRSTTAVIIPVHNGLQYTRRCIASLRGTSGPDFMVFVVDDGSSDGTRNYLAEHEPDVVVVPGSGELWWSGGVNAGCQAAIEAGAERLVLLNNDNVAISLNLIDDLGSVLDTGASCVCAVSLFRDPWGQVRIFQAGGEIDWSRAGLTLTDHGHPCGERYEPQRRLERREWLPGMALAFDRETFLRHGGFDDAAFPQYRGDTDFTLRVARAGGECVTTYNSWVLNDVSQNGVNFFTPMSLPRFVEGLSSRRSNYQLRSTLRFAWRYCPRHLILWHLFQFYGRYVYAAIKSHVRPRAFAIYRPPTTEG